MRSARDITGQTTFGNATIPQNRGDAINCVRTNSRSQSFTVAVNCDRESQTDNHAIAGVGLALLANSG